MKNEIDIIELLDLMKRENVNLIDIRDNYTYSKGTIKNAKNIPRDYLLINYNKYLNKNEKYYIFCSYGMSSKKICDYLSKMNYNVINVIGGYNSYIEDSIK